MSRAGFQGDILLRKAARRLSSRYFCSRLYVPTLCQSIPGPASSLTTLFDALFDSTCPAPKAGLFLALALSNTNLDP
jgi:hypothetical protein